MSEHPHDRPLPHNLEAERCILGAVLLDNQALATAMQVVRAEDFFLPQNRHIFTAMVELATQAQAIDTITLMERLATRGNLENAGGVAYLSQLADGLPRVSNVGHYARIVKEKAVLRSLIYAAASIQEQALAGHEAGSTLCTQATQTFSTISASSGPASWVDVAHTAKDYQENTTMTFSIDGFLQDGGATMIGGLSGHGKTLIMLSIARALLSPRGTMLWGHFRVLEPAERVLYLIPESTLAPFIHRLKLFGLYEHAIAGERFFSRTLTKGPTIPLDDPRILAAAKGAHVFLDTAARFGEGDENSAGDNSRGLAADIFQLLAAGARAVICAHHAPKAFSRENIMMLETVLRGSGDMGAMLSTAWGIKQIDAASNTIHVENVKGRDFQPCGPFQLQGRPFIDDTGDFHLLRAPGQCGSLADEMPDTQHKGGGAPQLAREARSANIALLRGWLAEDSGLTSEEIVRRFADAGIEVARSTVRKYRTELSK